jgi:hypothetical protein
VAVIPVGAGVLQGKLEDTAGAGFDRRRCQVGHSVLRVGDKQPVPMHGSFLAIETFLDSNPRGVANAEPQGRAGNNSVDRKRADRLQAGWCLRFLGDGELVFHDIRVGGDHGE